jgi:hypothetical protein
MPARAELTPRGLWQGAGPEVILGRQVWEAGRNVRYRTLQTCPGDCCQGTAMGRTDRTPPPGALELAKGPSIWILGAVRATASGVAQALLCSSGLGKRP